MSETIYVAGPMTGYPEFNYPAFYAAEGVLREVYGHGVVNPARLDPVTLEEHKSNSEMVSGANLPAFLRRDFRHMMNECTGVALLDGWEASKGANAELAVARLTGMKVWTLSEAGGWDLKPSALLPLWYTLASAAAEFMPELYDQQMADYRAARWNGGTDQVMG